MPYLVHRVSFADRGQVDIVVRLEGSEPHFVDIELYLKAQKVRQLISQDFKDAFANVDVIAGPTTPTPRSPVLGSS